VKRDRNTFFTNYSAQNQSYIPDMPNNFGPYTQSSQSSNYYSGPDIGYSNDIDNRLSKLERQVNRLDARLSKIENMQSNVTTTTTTTTGEPNYQQNMYMI